MPDRFTSLPRDLRALVYSFDGTFTRVAYGGVVAELAAILRIPPRTPYRSADPSIDVYDAHPCPLLVLRAHPERPPVYIDYRQKHTENRYEWIRCRTANGGLPDSWSRPHLVPLLYRLADGAPLDEDLHAEHLAAADEAEAADY